MKTYFQSVVKLVYLLLLIQGSVHALSAQTTIYSENFGGASNGATSGTGWYTSTSGCNGSFMVYNNGFVASDTDCDAMWISNNIDISGYTDVSISMLIEGAGAMEPDDYIQVGYSVDGGTPVIFSANGYKQGVFSACTATASGINGSSLSFGFIAKNSYTDEYHLVDNIVVTGTPVVSTPQAIFSEDFNSASPGATSGTGWSTQTSGCNGYFIAYNSSFVATDTDCDAKWTSDAIDISNYTAISIEMLIEGAGVMESSDYIKVWYRVDGGAEVTFPTNGYKQDNFYACTAAATGISGSSLVFGFTARNSHTDEYHIVDNIIVTGTPVPTASTFELTHTKTDASCFGGSNGAIDLEVSAGTSSSGSGGCSSGETSPNTCTGCTSTASGSGSLSVTAGQTVCIPSGSTYSGHITLNGGTLVVCGNIIPWSLNLNSGTLIINSSMSVNGLNLNGAQVKNYGTLNISGWVSANSRLENHGTMSVSGGLTVNSGGHFQNTGTASLAGSLTANKHVENSGSLIISGHCTINGSGKLRNDCTTTITGNLTANDSLINNGTLTANGTTTVNGTGRIAMGANAKLSTANLTLNGRIENSGSGCARFNVSGNTTINGSGRVGSNIDLCDANGIETNWGTVQGTTNCSCSATGTSSGSGATYTYTWSTGATTQDITGLSAGTYYVSVDASTGGRVIDTITMGQGSQITLSATATNISCNGSANGSIDLAVSGGTSPYSYEWSNGASTQDITGLAVDYYTVTVTDAASCTATISKAISQPGALSVSLSASEETSTGSADGEIAATVSGGTSPYSYAWSNNATTQNLSGVSGGSYTLTVTDSKGCTATATETVITLSSGPGAMDGYCYRKPITINSSKVSGSAPLTDFPVLLSFTDADIKTEANGGKTKDSNGYDIVFTLSDGTTVLSHQIDHYNATTGEARFWVKIPSLSPTADTEIFMYYGNENANSNPSTAGTWKSNYKAVWHFDENMPVNSNVYDATSNGINGTKEGSTHDYGYISGKIGMTYKLDGVNDYYEFNTDLNQWLGGTASLTAWVKTTQTGNSLAWNSPGITGVELNGQVNDIYWGVLDENGKICGQAGDGARATSIAAINNNNWHHVAITRNSSTGQIKMYINGSLASAANSETGLKTTPFYSVGRIYDNGSTVEYFNGAIDELRIVGNILEPDWIATEYNNQNSPATFHTMGSEEDLNCNPETNPATDPYAIYWTGAVSAVWNITDNWSTNQIPTCNDDVVIPQGTPYDPTLGKDKIGNVRNITINSGAQIIMAGSGRLHICGDVTNNGTIELTGGTVAFVGTEEQKINGTVNPVFYDVIFENTSPTGVVLQSTIEINNTVSFNDGRVITGADTLRLNKQDGKGKTILNYSDSSYVVGILNRAIKKNSDTYIFPVGTPSLLFWAEIKNGKLEDVNHLTCEFTGLERHDNNLLNVTDQDITYTRICSEGVWVIEPDNQPTKGKYDIKVSIEHFSGLQDNDFGILKRPKGGNPHQWSHGNGTKDLLGSVGRILFDGYARLKQLTSFSEFAVGTGGGSDLPIQLLNFEAEYIEDQQVVKLNWITEVEINNDYFIVQRSMDGLNYETVAIVDGAGNTSIQQNYESFDNDPPVGLVYYRLKQVDFDKGYSYSDMIPVNIYSHVSSSFKVYPNPAKDHVNVSIKTAETDLTIMVMDLNGSLIKMFQGINESDQFSTRIALEEQLPAGQYFVRVIAGEDEMVEKLIIMD